MAGNGESPWELFSAPAAMMHVWYAGAALTIVLHTGDLTAAYFGKGWKNSEFLRCWGPGNLCVSVNSADNPPPAPSFYIKRKIRKAPLLQGVVGWLCLK